MMGAQPQIAPRDNVMLAYQHKVPFYMPSMFTDINLFQANPTMERFCGMEQVMTHWCRMAI